MVCKILHHQAGMVEPPQKNHGMNQRTENDKTVLLATGRANILGPPWAVPVNKVDI